MAQLMIKPDTLAALLDLPDGIDVVAASTDRDGIILLHLQGGEWPADARLAGSYETRDGQIALVSLDTV